MAAVIDKVPYKSEGGKPVFSLELLDSRALLGAVCRLPAKRPLTLSR